MLDARRVPAARRPVSWVNCAGGQACSWVSPVNLMSLSITTLRAGKIHAQHRRMSRWRTTRTSPSAKHCSTVSLNAGTRPAWWLAMPRSGSVYAMRSCRAQRDVADAFPRRSSAIARIRSASSVSVKQAPARSACSAASSHPRRLKTNQITSSGVVVLEMIRVRRGVSVSCTDFFSRLPRSWRRPRSQIGIEAMAFAVGLPAEEGGDDMKSMPASVARTAYRLVSSTGRFRSTTQPVAPQIDSIQPAKFIGVRHGG